MTEHIPYFAYGSNMIEAQMSERAPAARLVGTAHLDGYIFIIAAGGHASIIASPGRTVYGLLWEITAQCMTALDCFEGVAKGIYRKETMTVTAITGPISTLVYIAADNTHGKNKYGARWQQILNSSRRHGFPSAYIAALEALS